MPWIGSFWIDGGVDMISYRMILFGWWWNFKDFCWINFYPDPWQKWSNFDEHIFFSNGLVQATTRFLLGGSESWRSTTKRMFCVLKPVVNNGIFYHLLYRSTGDLRRISCLPKKKGIKIDMYALRWLSDDLKSQKFVDGRNSLNSHMFLVLKKTPPERTSHVDQNGKSLLDLDVQYQCKLCKVVSRQYDDLHRYAITFNYVTVYLNLSIYIHVYTQMELPQIRNI